jgi:hypothetical protein
MDFGEVQDLKVCVLYENSLNLEEVGELEKAWAKELELYKIHLEFTRKIQTARIGFFSGEVIQELYTYKLEENCDRILYLVGREGSDIAFESLMIGLFLATGLKLEIQGAVETYSNTRGYIKAKYISLLQLLFDSPESTLIHEGYHLLGCPHALWKDECYQIIQSAKKRNLQNESSNKIFSVKSLSGSNPKTWETREDVDKFLGSKKELPKQIPHL